MRWKTAILVAALAGVLAASAASAQSVVMPQDATPVQTVAIRKFLMRTNNACLRDIRLKIERGYADLLTSPGLSISANAQALPFFLQERHESAYPFEGSNRFYKGASPQEVQAAAEYLNAQALKLVRLSGAKDTAKLDAQLTRIKRACIACHKRMRGEYGK